VIVGVRLLRRGAQGGGDGDECALHAYDSREIPPRVRLSRLDIFGPGLARMDVAQRSLVQTIASNVDLHMSKRALPAVPEVLRLLGVQAQAIAEAPPEDPDETRIVPVEVA